jgi:hypothetical protein
MVLTKTTLRSLPQKIRWTTHSVFSQRVQPKIAFLIAGFIRHIFDSRSAKMEKIERSGEEEKEKK